MVNEKTFINCPFCGRELEDSHEPSILCRYCGKKFRRMDVFNEDEKLLRQTMIIDLSTTMSKYKTTANVGMIFGTVCLLGAVAMLFSKEMLLVQWLLVAFFAALTVVWWTLFGINSAKYAASQSKLFDLSGGRRIE